MGFPPPISALSDRWSIFTGRFLDIQSLLVVNRLRQAVNSMESIEWENHDERGTVPTQPRREQTGERDDESNDESDDDTRWDRRLRRASCVDFTGPGPVFDLTDESPE